MSTLTVQDSIKMLREAFCQSQAAIIHLTQSHEYVGLHRHVKVLGRLIDECDRQRPLGPDGKHDDRHTPTCGCES